MDNILREKLLLRMFSSIEYMREFVEHYNCFLDLGFDAFDRYQNLAPHSIPIANASEVKKDVHLWSIKVIPNFRRMRAGSAVALDKAIQGNTIFIEGLTGSFRGLSRDMDGIRESFMDFIDPEIKKRYFDEWKIAGVMGDNIYYTLCNYWRTGEIFNTNITGVIDEKELLKYLQPGEQP